MKKIITESDFVQAFRDYGREDNFSYAGLCALFEFLEEMEADTGDDSELDVIALCCDFAEYDDLEEFQSEYNADDYPDMESVQYATTIIEIPHTERFIVLVF